MKYIKAIAGISCVGKTYYRTRNPALMYYPYVDIADIYKANPQREYWEVWLIFVESIKEKLGSLASGGTLVVEAAFTSNQRTKLKLFMDEYKGEGLHVEYFQLDTPSREVLLERAKKDLEDHLAKAKDAAERRYAEKYYHARVGMIVNLT